MSITRIDTCLSKHKTWTLFISDLLPVSVLKSYYWRFWHSYNSLFPMNELSTPSCFWRIVLDITTSYIVLLKVSVTTSYNRIRQRILVVWPYLAPTLMTRPIFFLSYMFKGTSLNLIFVSLRFLKIVMTLYVPWVLCTSFSLLHLPSVC